MIWLRGLTREEWLWYAAFPVAFFIGMLGFGLLLGNGPLIFTFLIPASVGSAVALQLAGWWIIHTPQPVSKRATDLSVSGLFASVLLETTRYALSVNSGIFYSILETCSLVCFVPGLLCAFHYLGVGGVEEHSSIMRGQKIIIDGFFSLIYVYVGSYSAHNIVTVLFHADFLPPQVWLWLGRAGLQAGVLLMGVGVLVTRRQWTFLATAENPDKHKEAWGEWLQGLTFVLTMIGVFLSGFSISVLGGLVVIVVGVLFYPIGWLVTMLSKPKVSSNPTTC